MDSTVKDWMDIDYAKGIIIAPAAALITKPSNMIRIMIKL